MKFPVGRFSGFQISRKHPREYDYTQAGCGFAHEQYLLFGVKSGVMPAGLHDFRLVGSVHEKTIFLVVIGACDGC